MRLFSTFRILAFCFFLGSTGNGTPEAQVLTPIFNLPNCKSYLYAVPISTESGEKIEGPKGGLFCTSADFSTPLYERSNLVRALSQAATGRTVESVVTSSYLYSEAGFASWLCGLTYSNKATITLLAQRTGDSRGRVSEAFALEMDKCAIAPRFAYFGCDVFDAENMIAGSAKCANGKVNVLHLKAIHMAFTDGTAMALLGSGNFNRSLYANIEDWLLYTGPESSSGFPTSVLCMTSAVQKNSGRRASATEISGHANECMSTWPKQQMPSGFSLDFAPSQGASFHERLLASIESADAIDIAAQAFEDPKLVTALLGNKSATIRIVADDDWYWALRGRKDYYTANYEKLKWVTQLRKGSVRYLQTNHANMGGTGNTLHTRMVSITKGGIRTVFTGSAHYRAGSFLQNVEHLVNVTDVDATQRYNIFFEALWNRGLLWEDMPMVDAPVLLQ